MTTNLLLLCEALTHPPFTHMHAHPHTQKECVCVRACRTGRDRRKENEMENGHASEREKKRTDLVD